MLSRWNTELTAARSAKRWLSPCRAPTLRTSACFGRSCRGNRADWSISSRSFASPDSRSRLASPSRPTAPAIRWVAVQHQARPHQQHRTRPSSSATPGAELAGKPRWDWNTRLLWTSSIGIRKEVIGKVPDGLRINWYFTDGHFVGPHHEGVVLPGGGDFMRIRHDGIGIVNVITEMLQTRTGARLYCSYGGMFDLGPDGYARAMRNDFDAFPPFVTSPTYTTADKELAWLNRAQCLGLGRVDTNAMRIEADVYVVSVGERKRAE
jgi:hypothetical protein